MWYLSIVSVLPTVGSGRHAPSLEKQRQVPAFKLSNVLLRTGLATPPLQKLISLKVYAIFRTFLLLYFAIGWPVLTGNRCYVSQISCFLALAKSVILPHRT